MATNDIFEKINTLSTAADFIGEKSYNVQIERIKASVTNKAYLMSVMGQFSAGKSRLINNILGRTVLPVNITETTALVTFIKYGEEEHVDLVMEDGRTIPLSFEVAVALRQNNNYNDLLEQASSLNISLNCELLKSGLIIADTPGVNTVINRHVEFAAKIIDNSDAVLYVMGKSFTDTDSNFVNGLKNSGINVTFVRTHMDALKSSEENIDQTIHKEKTVLENYTINPVFFVSSDEANKYYQGVDELKNWIKNRLASDIDTTIEKSAELRISFIAEALMNRLVNMSCTLSMTLNTSADDYAEKKAEIENALAHLEEILSQNKKSLKQKMDNTTAYANNDIKEVATRYENSIHKKLETINSTDFELYKKASESLVNNACAELRNTYLSYFNTALADNRNELETDLIKGSSNIEIDVDVPESFMENSFELDQIQSERQALESIISGLEEQLSQEENNSENIFQKMRLKVEKREAIEQALEVAKEELTNYPDYAEQYIEVQSATYDGENMGRTIGKIADWATLLMPGDMIAKGAIKVLQGCSKVATAAKAVKIATTLDKGAKVLESSTKIAKVIDTTVDISKATNMTRGDKIREGKARAKRQREILIKAQQIGDGYEKLKETRGRLDELKGDEDTATFLDYLTIEHWAAKIGKRFDKPQVLQIDRENENKYKLERLTLEENYRNAAAKAIDIKASIENIQDEVEKARLREEKFKQLISANKAKFDDINRRENVAKDKAQARALASFYAEEANGVVNQYCNYLTSDASGEIAKCINRYINTYDYSILMQISKKKAELLKIETQYNNNEHDELIQKHTACLSFIKELKFLISKEG